MSEPTICINCGNYRIEKYVESPIGFNFFKSKPRVVFSLPRCLGFMNYETGLMDKRRPDNDGRCCKFIEGSPVVIITRYERPDSDLH
jgi:hypothetical protein